MKIVVNDHSGHAFTLQLSKQFVQSGHEVLYAYSVSFQSPKGNFQDLSVSDTSLTVLPITVKGKFEKYSILKRRKQEIEYATQLIAKLETFQPDIVLSSTTPLFVQQHLQKYCIRKGIKFVFWCQDIYTIAIRQIARQRLGLIGFPLWCYFKKLESDLLRKSSHIISITPGFNDLFKKWKVPLGQVTCIPNWAPLPEITPVSKNNDWAKRYQVADKTCIVYSGTLGLKHNPSILSAAAQYFREHQEVIFIVISEGLGADFLQKEKEKHQLVNLMLLPFQEFGDMSQVLGTADILLAILENDASAYSVPSKVLAYLCAEKPIVLAMPPDNLSASIVKDNNAGYCIAPDNPKDFFRQIENLITDPVKRTEMGHNGRVYAEKNFDIVHIEKKFMQVFNTIMN
ncbi:MAG: glycosyltransferase family 4 protein [Mucilaginibacter sp.]|uniref:glycosyltransferase family 4 protein n=1 Tax=Mucilaginibacter sp. TaxID=1882438 RepID=UPI0031ABEFFC